MEDKCFFVRPNKQGIIDMNLISHVKRAGSDTEAHYKIIFTNNCELVITTEEYKDLLEAMCGEYSYYDKYEYDEDEYNGDDLYEQEETEVVTDYETLFNQDNKIHW